MKIRERLTYSNVTATLALVVALGTGGAWAAGEIGSRDIENNSIRSKDLRDRKAVKARDVKRDGLTGKEIKERTLDASGFVPLAGDAPADCDPIDSTFIDCAETAIRLSQRGKLLVIAAGDYHSEGGPAQLECRVSIDGANEPGASRPGEATTDNTSLSAADGVSRTRVTGRLSRGRHDVAWRCAQPGAGDGRLASPTLSVLGISGG